MRCAVRAEIRSVLTRLFRRKAPPEITLPPEIPVAGQVFTFQTAPAPAFGGQQTPGFAAIKTLGLAGDCIIVAVLAGIWSSPPSLAALRNRPILRMHRGSWGGEQAIAGVSVSHWTASAVPSHFSCPGHIATTRKERAICDGYSNSLFGNYGSLLVLASHAEHEWRFRNDREAWLKDSRIADDMFREKMRAEEEWQRNRLSGLTLAQLTSEQPFPGWSEETTSLPLTFILAARSTIREAQQELLSLGVKPRREDVRRILKRTVIWFNKSTAEAGEIVETSEREDIQTLLEEMCWSVKQQELVEEIDDWRRW